MQVKLLDDFKLEIFFSEEIMENWRLLDLKEKLQIFTDKDGFLSDYYLLESRRKSLLIQLKVR